jgi:hypothetical protein
VLLQPLGAENATQQLTVHAMLVDTKKTLTLHMYLASAAGDWKTGKGIFELVAQR